MGLRDKNDTSGSCQPSGLALLLSDGSGGPLLSETPPDDEVTAASFVYDIQDTLIQGDGLYACLNKLVAQRTQLEQTEVGSSAVDDRPGRLGPSCVEVDYISGQLEASGDTLISTANFSSCRANTCVFFGKWQYEATICTAGIMQIGWATLQCPFTPLKGVGDAPDSYAFDGKRVQKWHMDCTAYGEAWAPGDVIGCCLDLDRGEATFYRNGRSMGLAFSGIRTMQPHLAYFPAVSLSYAQRCELNFGAQPLLYPVPGYQPLHAPPPAPVTTAAAYLVSCLERLITAVHSQPYHDTAGNGATQHQQPKGNGSSSTVAAAAAAAAAIAADRRGSPFLCGLLPAPPRPQGITLSWDSWLLLGSIAIEQLAPHLLEPQIIASQLLPLMLRLAAADTGTASAGMLPPPSPFITTTPTSTPTPTATTSTIPTATTTAAAREHSTAAAAGDQPSASLSANTDKAVLPVTTTTTTTSLSSPLSALLQLLELCLEPELTSAVVNCLMTALSRRCVSAELVPEQFPYSASCPYLAVAVAVASRPGLRATWLRHPGLLEMLEGFLTRKVPSPDDLRSLVPEVWWRGCSELGAERERMRVALQALSTAMARVDDKQYELLCCLLGSPSGGDAREDALLDFLRYLVLKNRGATRDRPPPGLSDSTVLISAYFALVRMLRTALPQVDSFPAAELFVKTAMKAELEPVNSLVRLGGIVTHLCREAPITSPTELAPLHVPKHTQSTHAPTPASTTRPSTSAAASASPSASVGTPSNRAGCPPTPTPYSPASTSSHPPSCGPSLSPPPASPADEWVLSRLAVRPRLAAELTDLAMTLYAFSVGASVKTANNLSNTVAASLAGLEEVERHLQRRTPTPPSATTTPNSGPGPMGALPPLSSSYTAYLQAARDFFRQDIASNIQLGSVLRINFFSGWRQEASLSLAGWLSRMLSSAAALPGPLLSYVPTAYLDTILDTLTHLRHASEAAAGTALPSAALAPPLPTLHTHGALPAMLGLLVTLLHEPRICTPDAKEALVVGLQGLLNQPGMLGKLEACETARKRLVGAAVAAFDSRLWAPVSSVLLRLVRGQGFGEQRQEEQGGVGGGVLEGSGVFRELLVGELRPEGPALQPFLHRLFNMANWATSEFAATVADLHEHRSQRHVIEEQQQYRKAGLMFELVAGLLRLLEFVAAREAGGFLGPGPDAELNLNRLLEVVSFVLSHFTEGSDTRRLTELLTHSEAASTGSGAGGGGMLMPLVSSQVQIERSLLSQKVNKAHVLAPVVGALVGLWRSTAGIGSGGPQGTEGMGEERVGAGAGVGEASPEVETAEGRAAGGGGLSGTEAGEAAAESRRMSGSGGGSSSGRGDDGRGSEGDGGVRCRVVLLDALLRHSDARTEKQMAYLRAVDWRGGLPAAEPSALEAGERAFSELLAAVAVRRKQLAAGGEGQGVGGGGDIPEELLDPITSVLMTDPVVLPDSQVTVDRATIERHFLTSLTDPFSRTSLTRDALRSNEEMKRKLLDWRNSRGRS